MIRRFSRLLHRSMLVYDETGSIQAAVRYFVAGVRSKLGDVGRHLLSLRHVLLPWRLAAQARRIEYMRTDGQLAVAVMASGGLGDFIVIGRFLRDLNKSTEGFTFDVFCASPAVAQLALSKVPGFAGAFPDTVGHFATRAYDLTLQIHQMVVVHHEATRWKRVRQSPRMLAAIQRAMRTRSLGLEPYVLNHPRLDNGLARKAVFSNRSRRDYLHHMTGIPYGGDLLPLEGDDSALARFGLEGKRFITVHNGFDTNFFVTGQRATKCYPYFDEVVASLKAARPEILVVQIGTTTSEPIATADVNLIGRTSLREVIGLLRHAELHLDNEGGLVHVAACHGRRSLVVFGPTPSDYFGYPGNINMDPRLCGGCWWIDELWMDRCPRGLKQPECTYTQPPTDVAAAALQALPAREAQGHVG